MFRHGLIFLSLVCFLGSAGGQEPAPATGSLSRIRVKSPYIAAYKDGADVNVKAFLFRYVAPGFKPGLGSSHSRFVHVLVVTNVEPATCETAFFHWDPKKGRHYWDRNGAVPDLRVLDESKFLLIFAGHFPDEPEYWNMGEDDFVMSGSGSIDSGGTTKIEKGSAEEQNQLNFAKLGRNERFAVMSTLLAPIWPFRPFEVSVTARTTRGDKTATSRIPSVRPPNFVFVKGEVDKLVVAGEVPVSTCK